MTNENQGQVELELSDIERIWHLFHLRLCQGRISKATGLPIVVVQAVLFGHYSIKGDKAVVDMPVKRQ